MDFKFIIIDYNLLFTILKKSESQVILADETLYKITHNGQKLNKLSR